MVDKLDKVLVVIRPDSEKQPGIERLRYLAKSFDPEIRLITCDYNQYLVEGYYFAEAELPALREEYLKDRKEMLEALAEPLRDAGLTVSTEAIWSYPNYRAVVDEIAEFQPDLVIHNVHRHAAISRLLLSHEDWQLTRHCEAPLLLVKDKPWKANPVVLAAVDPMHGRHKPEGLDHRILRMASGISEKFEGELYSVHAYGQFPLSGLYPADAEEQHRNAFNKLADEFEIPETRRLLMDESAEYAVKCLEEDLDVDLVVAGSISRSLLKDVFIGSTAEKLLDSLDCDVLLLRPDRV